jgi:hypothetical protein
MLIPYTILEECLVLGSNLVCSGALLSPKRFQACSGTALLFLHAHTDRIVISLFSLSFVRKEAKKFLSLFLLHQELHYLKHNCLQAA